MSNTALAVAELATRTVGAISLAMPVEASGEQWFHYAYDDWQAHAALFATDFAKVLIRDNPGLEPGQRAAQAEQLAKVLGLGGRQRPRADRGTARAGQRRRPRRGGRHRRKPQAMTPRCGQSTPCRSSSTCKITG